jgi:hypothetical protein
MSDPAVKTCPFCGLPPSRAAKSYGTPIVCCGNVHCTLGASDADWYEIGDWNIRPIEDALRAERDAALADVVAWRGFAGSVAVAVHPDGTGAVIADHLAIDDLPDLLSAVGRVVGERDAALARVGTAERDRDIFRGAFLATKTERAAALAQRDSARAERDRLRAVIAEAADDLPLHPEGAHLTPPEADAEAVRLALLAALRGEA